MSVLSDLLGRRPEAGERRGLSLTDVQPWIDLGIVTPTASGVAVTEEGALRSAAVWACVRVLAESVASLPLITYERLARGKERAREHGLYRLLRLEPNPMMTSFEWREALMGHLALWGNGYNEIEIDDAGRVTALWPLRPDKMVEVRKNDDGSLTYIYEMPGGQRVGLPGWRVWHLRGLSGDGVMGYSPIGAARQAIGLSLAAEEFGARFFGNGARPGGVLQHPGVLGDEGFKRVKASWQATHGGLSNANRVAILEEGMTYQAVGIPPEDAQFLETRKFQRSEIASIFRVPPHLIGDLERATFSNIEHQSIEFVTHTLRPWLVRWEQAINLRLMTRAEQERYFAEFVVDALLRGDTASRYQAHAIGRQNGWLSANDIREMENMNPIEGGDVYLVPLNMVPAENAGEMPAAADEEGTTDDEERAGSPRPEERVKTGDGEVRAEQWNAAAARQRLQRTYVPLFEAEAGRLVRREANDVWAMARRLMKGEGGWQALRSWLVEFYEEFAGIAAEGYEPVVRAYAAQVADLTGRELGQEAPVLAAFVAAYLAEMGGRHAAQAQAELMAILEAEQQEALASIEAQLEKRKAEQPARTARYESVRTGSAVALAAYRALGVSKKTWVTFGDSCPYCTALGGRTISLEGFFLGTGTPFLPEGASAVLMPGGNIGHAPLHEGCDCVVVAG